MTDLALCIVSTTMLFVIFKYFTRFGVNNFVAIAVNYVVAGGLGLAFSLDGYDIGTAIGKPWFYGAAFFGVCFFTTFNLIALSSQRVGVGITSVANKMSLVIPVVSGILFFHEKLDAVKGLGLILALISVAFAIWPRTGKAFHARDLYLPVLIFFGSGLLDAGLNAMRSEWMTEADFPFFLAVLFLVAAAVGLAALVVTRTRPALRSVLAGMVLGVPNYLSILFLLRALDIPDLPSVYVFPVVNTGIVLLGAVMGMVLFSERPSPANLIGIELTGVAIFMMSV
jgi:drug/metabolite transporter (DMT)-like permease